MNKSSSSKLQIISINGTCTFDENGQLFSIALQKMAEFTRIEKYIIQAVKDKRIAAGITQIALSQKLNMSDSFVGHVETPKRRAKYNVNHVNALAKIFKCSPKDFMPEKPL